MVLAVECDSKPSENPAWLSSGLAAKTEADLVLCSSLMDFLLEVAKEVFLASPGREPKLTMETHNTAD